MDALFDGDGVPRDCNKFTTFVLSKNIYTQEEILLMNQNLAKDHTSIGELLRSKVCSAVFVSDFTERVQRILSWLQAIEESTESNIQTINKAIIHVFNADFVLPLLDQYPDCYTVPGFADLLVSTTYLLYVYRKRTPGPKSHKLLLEKISKSEYLISQILPSIEGAELIQKILAEAQAGAEIQSFGTVETLAEWTTAAAKLCRGCRASHGHGVIDELNRWNSVLELTDSLTAILTAILTVETSRHPKISEYLSEKDKHNLELFNMRVPSGIGAMEGIILRLRERDTFNLFHTFVKSFPCALCLRSKNTSSSVAPVRQPAFSINSFHNSFTGTLFGQRLGEWRICFSEKAFKDMLAANKEGTP